MGWNCFVSALYLLCIWRPSFCSLWCCWGLAVARAGGCLGVGRYGSSPGARPLIVRCRQIPIDQYRSRPV